MCQSRLNLTFNQQVVWFNCCHQSNFPLAMTSKMSMISQWLIRTSFSISKKIYLTTSPLSRGCKVLFSLRLVLKKNIPILFALKSVPYIFRSSNYVSKYLSSSSLLKNLQVLSIVCKASVEIVAVFQFFGTVRQFKISHVELSSLIVTVTTGEGFIHIILAFSVGYLKISTICL